MRETSFFCWVIVSTHEHIGCFQTPESIPSTSICFKCFLYLRLFPLSRNAAPGSKAYQQCRFLRSEVKAGLIPDDSTWQHVILHNSPHGHLSARMITTNILNPPAPIPKLPSSISRSSEMHSEHNVRVCPNFAPFRISLPSGLVKYERQISQNPRGFASIPTERVSFCCLVSGGGSCLFGLYRSKRLPPKAVSSRIQDLPTSRTTNNYTFAPGYSIKHVFNSADSYFVSSIVAPSRIIKPHHDSHPASSTHSSYCRLPLLSSSSPAIVPDARVARRSTFFI